MFRNVFIGVVGMVVVVAVGLTITFFWLVQDKNLSKPDMLADSIKSVTDIPVETTDSSSDTTLLTLKTYSLADLLEVVEIVTQVISPTPLDQLASTGVLSAYEPLSTAGVVAWTNVKRIEMSLPALTESTKLNEVARLRLEDMFDNQYFDHISPIGVDVSAVSKNTGYNFIVIGENLALGGFPSDEAVVEAWMDSTGHKANILARRFQEIGVAVREGDYKGRRARMAVQIFGTPLDTCDVPSSVQKQTILANKEKILSLGAQLDEIQNDIDNLDTLNASARRQAVRNFNRLAIEHNNLLEVTQASIAEYNRQVQDFNNCAKSI